MTLGQQVKQFNETYQVTVYNVPTLPNEQEKSRIDSLIREEYLEVNGAMDEDDLLQIAKELTDVLYVTAQQMDALGLPVDALLREVQRSNMSKLGADGKPIFREDGKVLKGPNYSQADIKTVLKKHGADV